MSINGTNSEEIRLTFGVPQSSLLSPRLNSVFTNDLPLSLDSKMETFVDRTPLPILLVTPLAPFQSKLKISCIDYLSSVKFNSMFIHPAKSEVKFIWKTIFIVPIRLITIDNKRFNGISSSSCLGVKLDNNLNWSLHIKMVHFKDFQA